MEGQFIWYELMTTDTEAAGHFYSAVIGWQAKKADNTTAEGRPYTLFNIPGHEMSSAGMLALTPEMTEDDARPAWMGYVAVNDVDTKASEFEQNGGTIHMPPTDIPGIGRIASAADPHGAMIYIFKPVMPEAPLPDMPKPGQQGTVGWNELYAGDGAEAFEFYSKMFGWTKDQTMDMGPMGIYQIFAHDGQPIGGMMTKQQETPSPHWNYVFSVDALDAAVDKVTSNGGTIVAGPMEVPGDEWAAQCLDPQGAAFGLVAPRR